MKRLPNIDDTKSGHATGNCMTNPWLSIPADEYDTHLAHPQVRQRQFLDQVFASALDQYRPNSVLVMGCATGGGLDRVDPGVTKSVTAIDLNPAYLQVTCDRYSGQGFDLQLIESDLQTCELPEESANLVYCGLVLEYVDPAIVLARAANWLHPEGVMVIVIQLASEKVVAITETGCNSLQRLTSIMNLLDEHRLRQLATKAGLIEVNCDSKTLSTGKRFRVGSYRRKRE